MVYGNPSRAVPTPASTPDDQRQGELAAQIGANCGSQPASQTVWTEERRQVKRDAALLWYARDYAVPAHEGFDDSFRRHAVHDRQPEYFAVA
jgi:hypothetical protein